MERGSGRRLIRLFYGNDAARERAHLITHSWLGYWSEDRRRERNNGRICQVTRCRVRRNGGYIGTYNGTLRHLVSSDIFMQFRSHQEYLSHYIHQIVLLPRDATQSTVLPWQAVRPSVRLFVRLSVYDVEVLWSYTSPDVICI